MKRRQWDAKTKAAIVLQGRKGKAVAKLCTEHQISQAQYYQWREQFLTHAGQGFEVHQQSQRETRLQQENARLKQLVGESNLELKKTTRCGNEAAALNGHGRAEYGTPRPDRNGESGASVLGLPSCLGVSALY